MRVIKKKSRIMENIEREYNTTIEELLRQLYVDENKSIHHISQELGITYLTAQRWLKRANITSRQIYF